MAYRIVLIIAIVTIIPYLLWKSGLILTMADDFFYTTKCRGAQLQNANQFFDEILMLAFLESPGQKESWPALYSKGYAHNNLAVDVSEKIQLFFEQKGLRREDIEIISCLGSFMTINDSPNVYHSKAEFGNVRVIKTASLAKFIFRKIPNDFLNPERLVLNVFFDEDNSGKISISEATVHRFIYSMY